MRNAIKHALRSTLTMSLLLGCACCSQPMGPIAGGELEGELAEWPDDWTFTEDIDNVLLQTNPDDPYSVTIWGVAKNGDFFVMSGDKDNQWALYIADNTEVRLSVEGVLYDARALRVTDETTIRRTLPAFVEKYEIDYEVDLVEERVLYRIVPR